MTVHSIRSSWLYARFVSLSLLLFIHCGNPSGAGGLIWRPICLVFTIVRDLSEHLFIHLRSRLWSVSVIRWLLQARGEVTIFLCAGLSSSSLSSASAESASSSLFSGDIASWTRPALISAFSRSVHVLLRFKADILRLSFYIG